MPIAPLLLVLVSFLVAPVPVRAAENVLSREIHLLSDADWGEAELILRFPLVLAHHAQAPSAFLVTDDRDGQAITHIDQATYEDDYAGFVAFLLEGYRFTVNGQQVAPELGTLSLVVTREATGLHPGLIASQQLLTVCTAFPGQERIEELEVVIQLYLAGSSPTDVIGIKVATPKDRVVETILTDHRNGRPVTHVGTGAVSRSFARSSKP